MRRSAVKWQLHHLYKAVLPGLCLPLANYLTSFPHLTCPRTLPNMCGHVLPRRIPAQRPLGGLTTLIMGWHPLPPSLTPKEPSCTRAVREVSPISGVRDVVLLSLYSRRAQLPPLTLSSEGLGKQSSSLLHLTDSSCSAQRPIYFLPHFQSSAFLTLPRCGQVWEIREEANGKLYLRFASIWGQLRFYLIFLTAISVTCRVLANSRHCKYLLNK